MGDKYQNKYRIPSARLSTWDYGTNGSYFITTCTAKRLCYFGKIANGEMFLCNIGRKARECWLEIPSHFQFVTLDEFIVMPNHIHGIITINKPAVETGHVETGHVETGHVETGHALSLRYESGKSQLPRQPHPRFRNQGKNTISSMVGSFKSSVTKWCNENEIMTNFDV